MCPRLPDDTVPPDYGPAATIPAPPPEMELEPPSIPRSASTLDWSRFATDSLDEDDEPQATP